MREQLIEGAGGKIADSIDQIAQGLATKQAVAVQSDEEETLAGELEQMPDEIDENQRLVQTQLALICRQLGRVDCSGMRASVSLPPPPPVRSTMR